MTTQKLTKVRRLAIAAVLGNLAIIALLGSVLPQPALVLLPIVALMLPLLSAAGIEEALRCETGERPNCRTTRPRSAARLALRHATHTI